MTIFTTIISAADLGNLLDRGKVRLFDCTFDLAAPASGKAAYAAGHLPGAFYLDLDQDLSSPPDGTNGRHPLPDPDVLSAKLRACGVSEGEQLVAYDRSGGPYAARFWWLLRWLGHEAVAVLDGGVDAWTAEGRALESGGTAAVPAGNFEQKRTTAMTVSAADLTAALGSERYLVVDARNADRFKGVPNPLDPVAGHIPGALNRFFMTNLDERGRWKPADQLREELSSLIGREHGMVVQQCGSGVTACHNALAFTHAGLGDYLLYPGSWSEWISDPARPVATGAA